MGRSVWIAGAALAVVGLSACETTGLGTEAEAPVVAQADMDKLAVVLAARSDEDKARDADRRPAETLAFFGVAPDMVVVETLPGRGPGWYTRVLAPYLAPEGALYGSNYSTDRFAKIFGDGFDDAAAARIAAFPDTWPAAVKELADATQNVGAFLEGEAPAELNGTVDAYLYVRALHHYNRYEAADLDAEAGRAFALVKPGGFVGVVQHRAPEENADDWANGSNGYLKQSRVVEAFTGAGFVLEDSSEINANPADQPTEEDFVWRLPPSFAFGDEGRETYAAIGESDRMTLRFRKPL